METETIGVLVVYEVAYLLMHDVPLLRMKGDYRFVFIFERAAADDLLNEYRYGTPMVHARAFAAALRDVRTEIVNQREKHNWQPTRPRMPGQRPGW